MFVTFYGLAAVSWACAYHTGLLIRHKGEIERLEIRYESRISSLETENKYLEEAKEDLKKKQSSARRAHERDVATLRRPQEELSSALASARQQVGHLLQRAPARASVMPCHRARSYATRCRMSGACLLHGPHVRAPGGITGAMWCGPCCWHRSGLCTAALLYCCTATVTLAAAVRTTGTAALPRATYATAPLPQLRQEAARMQQLSREAARVQQQAQEREASLLAACRAKPRELGHELGHD